MRLLRAAQRHGSGRARSLQQRCVCCSTAAMGPLSQAAVVARLQEALPNARDLSEAFPAIPPGRVIRCANPSSTSRGATEYLLGDLRVRDLIDLRAVEEILEDDPGSALMARARMLTYRRGWLRPGQLFSYPMANTSGQPTANATGQLISSSAAAGDPNGNKLLGTLSAPPGLGTHITAVSGASRGDSVDVSATSSSQTDSEPGPGPAAGTAVAVRHHISLLDRKRYYLSLASRLPTSVTAMALLTNFFNKPAARAMLLPYVNTGGLAMLYEMLMESSRVEICQVMEVLLRAAEARHCVMFFCRAGKDRTGLVAALVLAVAGASEEQIIADYARSDAYHRVALAGLEKREELAGLDRAQFERAPPEVMRATLEYVRRRYGSLAGYLTDIGFGPDRQQRLRELLTSDW